MAVNMTAHEDAEQATLFSWAEMQTGKYPELALLMHIPNGGKRSAAEAARFKAEGVKAGVPDLLLPVARQGKHGLWIEMKRRAGGRLSDKQSEWLTALTEQGYRAEVCCGWEEASKVLVEYLKDEGLNEVNPLSRCVTAPPVQVEPKKKARGKKWDFDEWMGELERG